MTSAPATAPWWHPFATPEGATVLHVDLTPDAAREAGASSWLDEEEAERWRRYPYSGPRRQFALCRAALRAVLCEQLGCGNEELSFPTSAHGKPAALVGGEPAPVSFNVSHSGRHGLVAFAPGGRLGVDVEELGPRRNLELLMEGVLGPAERAAVRSREGPDQPRFFLRLWTMKEALLKAHGRGFLLDATAFEIPPAVRRGATRGTLELPQEPGVIWQLEELGDERFAAALARDVSPGPAGSGAQR
ncbi:MAG: 4'-phosphopantetheinyl transferase superfamily protein [Chloroflexi bacterium]|nr:4'-phosphopantetheinyl transferase superfamily protein [Chloroflexota bacterium]